MRDVTRRGFLKGAGLAAAGVGGVSALAGQVEAYAAAGRAGRKRAPNVVLVVTDDQGYGDLGCHGNKVVRTPNLDKLQSESIRLRDFHVDPTCSPTRSALMTGRYSSRTGVWHTIMGRSLLRRDEVTMADVFKGGGYRTGIFGKWHLGDNYPFRAEDRGFDEVVVHKGGGVGQGPDYWGNDYFDDVYRVGGGTMSFKGYCTDVFFESAIQFIEANRDRPFFCYVATNAPHAPYNVADRYSRPYRDMGVERSQANFYGMITNIDENVGRLMRRLTELGLEDSTVVIFMTDNGTSAGDSAGMRGKKGSEYEGGHRVPCFIRWPGRGPKGGRDVERLTAHVDLLPTLIELCGLKKPEGGAFDGTSIVPLLRGEAGGWGERTLFVHSQRVDEPEKWRKSAVMTERWRLINGKELYDIKADPGQKNDIAGGHRDVVEELRGRYEKWWENISERFDEHCEIVIGSDRENPTRLMSHDWHCPEPVWSQEAVRAGVKSNGFWAVEVERDGTYELTLRRWPVEMGGGDSKAIGAVSARINLAEVDVSKAVSKDDSEVTFRISLQAGKTRLQTWFTNEKGELWGAYYVSVKRLRQD